MNKEQMEKKFREINFLRFTDDQTLEKIVSAAIEVSFEKDDYIIQAGRRGTTVYFFFEGSVSVWSKEDESLLFNLDAPNHFGEVALLEEKSHLRLVTVRANVELKAYMLYSDAFSKLILSNTKCAAYLQKLAAERMSGLNK